MMEEYGDVTKEYWEANRPATQGDIDRVNRRIDNLYEVISVLIGDRNASN